jgi:tRNA pseudouridine38-40 synthase
MKHSWKLTIEYDGSRYSGWQEQKNARSVMGELRKACEAVTSAEVEIQGAGRTDAGVHALAQVAHLRYAAPRPMPAQALRNRLNAELPHDIAIVDAEPAPPGFHARHDAISRVYLYRISQRKRAFAKPYVWWVKDPLDVPAMARAARRIEGRHDFSCFRASDPARPEESPVVVVSSANVELDPDGLILFRIEASHFVWRMVRRLTGALVRIGTHELAEEEFGRLLTGRVRNGPDIAAWTAPASGLFLESVRYPAPSRGARQA